MRKRYAFERGRCLSCASAGGGCVQFECSHYLEDVPALLTDVASARNSAEAQPIRRSKEYRLHALLPCLDQRLSDFTRPAQKDLYSTPEQQCVVCGCPAASHAVVAMGKLETQALAVASWILAPAELSLCFRQSAQDLACLGLERDKMTYGEVLPLSILRILDHVQELCEDREGVPDRRFYDLGCGGGKTAVVAALHPIGFSKCVGVELLPGLCAVAKGLGKRFEGCYEEVEKLVGREPPCLEFLEGDLFEQDLLHASVVFVNAACWVGSMATRLRRHLVDVLPDGCVLVTVREKLVHPDCFQLLPFGCDEEDARLSLPMTWGMADVHFAIRAHRADKDVAL